MTLRERAVVTCDGGCGGVVEDWNRYAIPRLMSEAGWVEREARVNRRWAVLHFCPTCQQAAQGVLL